MRSLRAHLVPVLLCSAMACGDDDGSTLDAGGDASTPPADGAMRDVVSPTLDAPPSDTAIPVDTAPAPDLLASAISLTSVSLFQVDEIPVVQSGAPVGTIAPLVADKPTVARFGVTVDMGFVPGMIRAVVEVTGGSGTQRFETPQMVSASSVQADEASFIVVPIDPGALNGSLSVRFMLVADSGAPATGAHPARVPGDGSGIAMTAAMSPALVVELIRFNHTPSGAAGVATVGDVELARVRRFLGAWLPISGSQLTVRVRDEVIATSDPIQPSGASTVVLTSAHNTVAARWLADAPPTNTVYVGLVSWDRAAFPCPTCGGGFANLVPPMMLGMAGVPLTAVTYWEPSAREVFNNCDSNLAACGMFLNSTFGVPTDSARYAARLDAFSDSLGSMLHEMGHALSLRHAPCRIGADLDASYPVGGGLLDQLVYDADLAIFRPASLHTDFMGYCQPRAMSAYHYGLLGQALQRIGP